MSYNTILEGDYKFVESNLSELYGVKLTTGEWEDVVITYGKVTIKENVESGLATLAFSYQVNDPGKFQMDELETNEAFKNYMGDVLSHIINTKGEIEDGKDMPEDGEFADVIQTD